MPPDPPSGCVDLVNLSSKTLDPPLLTVYIFGYYLPPRRNARWITQSDLEKSGISGS
jgi:hypothetical protein